MLKAVTLARRGSVQARWRTAGGWTLVELLIVISLIIVLAGISLASYRTAVTRSREAVLKEDLFRMRDAIDQYFADRSQYPAHPGRAGCPTATCGRFLKIPSPSRR